MESLIFFLNERSQDSVYFIDTEEKRILPLITTHFCWEGGELFLRALAGFAQA
jgi:hypothetical protein